MEGASFVNEISWLVFARKLAGKNAKEGIFSRFPGFRYRSIRCANGSAALPIGARLVGKNAHSDAKSFV